MHKHDAITRQSVILICNYVAINWHIKVPTQLPFELKLRMPNTDRGGRGYSDEYIEEIEERLYLA